MNKLLLSLIMTLFYINANCQVYVNQIGYAEKSAKIVLSKQPAQSFKIIEQSSGTEVYNNSFSQTGGVDPLTGFTLYRGEFSDFTLPGEYFIVSDNNDSSYSFAINDTVYQTLFKSSLKGYYYQRCGLELVDRFAGNYAHKICHTLDGIFHISSGSAGYRPSMGGWHDAGDFGKYVVNAGMTVGVMLLGYELFPARFRFDNLNIPESGNGIPDILDEVKYELKWLLTMQDTSDGGVYFKLTASNFAGFVMPNQDNSARYIYEKSSAATADFCAVTAMAARLYGEFDPSFAESCFNASLKAWQYIQDNLGIVPPGGFSNPSDTHTGEYGDGFDKDERLWASAELFKTTNEPAYLNYYELNLGSVGIFNSSPVWQNVGVLGNISILYNSNASPVLRDSHSSKLKILADKLIDKSNNNDFGVTLTDGEFYWGSNGRVMSNAVILILAYDQFGDVKYLNTAQRQLDYLLGQNAHDLSFVTQVGDNFVMHPHHRQSGADNNVLPVPGLLSGGPNEYLNDPLLKSSFTSSTPPALCFLDEQGSYASNEIAINWNSPLVFTAGYFNKPNSTEVHKGVNGNEKSFMIENLVNYPNPFNSETNITFTLYSTGTTELQIYDLLGRILYSKKIADAGAGKNTIHFGVRDVESEFHSGIYFYTITQNGQRAINKFIYLK